MEPKSRKNKVLTMARLGLQGFSMKQITDTLFVVCRVCTTMVHFVGEHAFLQQK